MGTEVHSEISTLLFLLTISITAGAADQCSVTKGELVGSWSRTGAPGFFEEFSLEMASGSHTFSSWLHQRPEISDAAWSFDNCQLTVAAGHDRVGVFRFKVIGLKRGKLHLYDESDQVDAVYVRSPDAP